MLRLTYTSPGGRRTVPVAGERVSIGRGRDNVVQLPDPSVSRRHCELVREGVGWAVVDLGSTNGVLLNQTPVKRAPIRPGDRLKIGVFELAVESDALPAPPPTLSLAQEFGEGTVVRRVADLVAELGLSTAPARPRPARAAAERAARAEGDRLVGALVRLASQLLRAEGLDQVLARVMDAAFEILPVERGFLVLGEGEDLRCELMRSGESTTLRPAGELPISKTLLRSVMDRGLALITHDARADARLAGGESILLHQIGSALCAPLWSGERIVGVMQLDSGPVAGAFSDRDLELACALANYAAVAVERLRYADQAASERELRGRLERYHSPAVVEEVLRRQGPGETGARRLAGTEASVLFADLVGFTPFTERASAEELAAALGGFFDHAVEAIFAAGGTLDKFIGDCVMAFFGAPVAQPDHARRAVAAALAIQRSVAAWNVERTAAGQPALPVRIAVHSGPVIVGDVGSERRVDYTVLGTTVNVAARLEEFVAGPGEVVIGPRTRELVGDSVRAEPLGPVRLAGIERPVAPFRLVSAEAPTALPLVPEDTVTRPGTAATGDPLRRSGGG